MIQIVENRVAIVPLENPDKIGSLWVPDIAKERLNQGFVKYVGPDVKDCKVGDYVLFSAYSGTLVSIQNEGKMLIMQEQFIVAKLEMDDNELKIIPGIFFQGPIERDVQFRELYNILHDELPGLEEDQYIALAQKLARRGLLGPESSNFFTANYEQIMTYVAQAFGEDLAWRDRIKVVNKRLLHTDYGSDTPSI